MNEKELSRLQEIARQKVANIIEFTLRQNNNPVDRNKIELVVEKEFGNNPIYQKILTKREPSQAEIMAAQDEFVGLIE